MKTVNDSLKEKIYSEEQIKERRALIESIFLNEEYIRIAAKLKLFLIEEEKKKSRQLTSIERQSFFENLLRSWEESRELNEATLKVISEFAINLPYHPALKPENLKDKKAIETYFLQVDPIKTAALFSSIQKIEERKKKAHIWSSRYETAMSMTIMFEGILHPLESVPIVNLMATPVLGGLRAICSYSLSNAISNDPGLGEENTTNKIESYKLSNYVGFLSVTLLLVSIAFPPLLPYAIGTFCMNQSLLAKGSMDDFAAVSKSQKHPAKKWLMASKGANVIHNVAAFVGSALLVAALFTPIGWIGAGAFILGSLAVLMTSMLVAKYTEFKAKEIIAKEKIKEMDTKVGELKNQMKVGKLKKQQNDLNSQLTKRITNIEENLSELQEKLQQKKEQNFEPSTNPQTVEPLTIDQPTVEILNEEPLSIELPNTESTIIEPSSNEPMSVEPTIAEPTNVEPITIEPITAEPIITEPITAAPITIEPTTAEPTSEPIISEPKPQKPKLS